MHPKYKVLGVGGRLFRPAHNRPLSRSTRGEEAVRVQTLITKIAIGMKGVVSKGERQRVK